MSKAGPEAGASRGSGSERRPPQNYRKFTTVLSRRHTQTRQPSCAAWPNMGSRRRQEGLKPITHRGPLSVVPDDHRVYRIRRHRAGLPAKASDCTTTTRRAEQPRVGLAARSERGSTDPGCEAPSETREGPRKYPKHRYPPPVHTLVRTVCGGSYFVP